MTVNLINRRRAIAGLVAIPAGLGLIKVAFGRAESQAAPDSAKDGELSHHSSAIHQEVVFKASRKRVYAALTVAAKFHAVTRLISDMKLPDKPTEITNSPGGAFLLFGGYISGRHVELVPDQRIVQAWRTASWDPGLYSVATFELADQGAETKLVFDQKGFPESEGEHLTRGWHSHYWEPLQEYLAAERS